MGGNYRELYTLWFYDVHFEVIVSEPTLHMVIWSFREQLGVVDKAAC